MKLSGLISHTIFKNEHSGFAIHRIALFDSDDDMIIKGTLSELLVDKTYELEGNYVDDPKYGIQFLVNNYKEILPEDKTFVLQYLTGPSFKGIGMKTAERIVDKYGETILQDIKDGLITKIDVKGVSQSRLDDIITILTSQSPKEEAINFLLNAGFQRSQVSMIVDAYGDATLELLTDNPYRMVKDINGVGFQTADKLGALFNFEVDHPYRRVGFLIDALKNETFSGGNSYLPIDLVHEKFASYDSELEALIQMGEFILDGDKVYHETQYEAEVYTANFIRNFPEYSHLFDGEVDQALESIEESLKIEFDSIQIRAIKQFIQEDISVLTGGPGTGKSTLLSGIVHLIHMLWPQYNILLCAPTGRAAKRLEDVTSLQASTIHSALRFDMESYKFGQNEENPLEFDIVIVDEFSMVDTWLFYNLLKASDRVKKFLFVGDKDQIPSVGPGMVLHDLLNADSIPQTILERNYRQEQGSEVIDCALSMNQGILNVHQYEKDVRFYGGQVVDTVVKLVEQAIKKGYQIHDIQVLAPMYAGAGGIDALNHSLQKLCNPKADYKAEVQFGKRIFREGDKLLQLKNQPDDFVFNGDIGTLVSIDGDQWVVNFEGQEVTYDKSSWINLSHAYAMSVHKAQGSEYPIVILVALPGFSRMLSRKLYYTGATRASKSLILVGDEASFIRAVENMDDTVRFTGLSERLNLEGNDERKTRV